MKTLRQGLPILLAFAALEGIILSGMAKLPLLSMIFLLGLVACWALAIKPNDKR